MAVLLLYVCNVQELAEDRFRRHRAELRRIRGKNNVMYAIPLQLPFHTDEKVVQAVKDLQVHRMHEANIQFACATRAIVYSNDVCSLWVYIAGVVQK